MAAFNYTQPADASVDPNSYTYRSDAIAIYYGATGVTGIGQGPIPYVARYSPSGSVAFLYIQTDRTLVTTAAMTTAANYTITKLAGTGSTPTVTSVLFNTGKTHIRLTLSGLMDAGSQYTLKVADNTFTDGVDSIYNSGTETPLFITAIPTQQGLDQTISVGTPVMS